MFRLEIVYIFWVKERTGPRLSDMAMWWGIHIALIAIASAGPI